ncbi:TIM barrel protein [Rhizobium leguminosarum bv. viciae]|nr:TIM barrel protein [Rhizobium leguminosarum bv. viciae]
MSLRFGGNTFSYMWSKTAEESLVELNGLGLNDFDILVSPGHLWPAELSGPDRSQLRRKLEFQGIRIESLNPPALDFNLGSLVDEVRTAAIDLYEQTMHLAVDLGARGVVVVPGRVSGLLPPPEHETRSRLLSSIGQLSRTAERLGLRLHLETHPLTSLPSAAALVLLAEEIGSPSIGIAYDLSNAEFIGENQANAIRTLGPRLTQLHVSDGSRQSWQHSKLGSGTVDFSAAFTAAREIGFEGIAILELISREPYQAYEESLSRIQQIVSSGVPK